MARTGHTSVGTRTRLGAAVTCVLAAALVLTTGSSASAAPAATVSGPVTGGNGAPVAVTTQFDLASVGYEQSEFFLSGTANAYRPTAALGGDGRWSVTPSSQAPFTTRMIVNRPSDPTKFNGTVVVEWLNVSIGSDVGVDWGFGHNELIRRGYAWVGVSAQTVGLNAAKAADPVRYAPLSHPGDSYSYDMFTQAGQAIRHDAATVARRAPAASACSRTVSRSRPRAWSPTSTRSNRSRTRSTGSWSTAAGRVVRRCRRRRSPPSSRHHRHDPHRQPAPVIVLQSETDVTRAHARTTRGRTGSGRWRARRTSTRTPSASGSPTSVTARPIARCSTRCSTRRPRLCASRSTPARAT